MKPAQPPEGDRAPTDAHDLAAETRVFVACPSCRHPLELPEDRSLPDRLVCDACGVTVQLPADERSEPRRQASA